MWMPQSLVITSIHTLFSETHKHCGAETLPYGSGNHLLMHFLIVRIFIILFMNS